MKRSWSVAPSSRRTLTVNKRPRKVKLCLAFVPPVDCEIDRGRDSGRIQEVMLNTPAELDLPLQSSSPRLRCTAHCNITQLRTTGLSNTLGTDPLNLTSHGNVLPRDIIAAIAACSETMQMLPFPCLKTIIARG